jgi:hypothetical protein
MPTISSLSKVTASVRKQVKLLMIFIAYIINKSFCIVSQSFCGWGGIVLCVRQICTVILLPETKIFKEVKCLKNLRTIFVMSWYKKDRGYSASFSKLKIFFKKKCYTNAYFFLRRLPFILN